MKKHISILAASAFAFACSTHKHENSLAFAPLPVPRSIGLSTGAVTGVKYPILAYSMGSGKKNYVLIGAIHGGYEWNSALLTWQLLKYFNKHRNKIPRDITLTIIPILNPDGFYHEQYFEGFSLDSGEEMKEKWISIIKPNISNLSINGRTNGHQVDLNRNFDCMWQSDARFGNTRVSAGTGPASEVETIHLMSLLRGMTQLKAVFLFHSQAGQVFPGFYTGLERDLRADILGQFYAESSVVSTLPSENSSKGYKFDKNGGFGAYPITGDASDWIVTELKVPSMAVELHNKIDIDFDQNLQAVLKMLWCYDQNSSTLATIEAAKSSAQNCMLPE